MKRAVVKLEVLVTCEVPDHIVERDMAEAEEHDMTEADVWYDYAIGAIHQTVEVRHGKDDDKDWIQLYAEAVDHEIDEGPEDV